MSQTTPDSVRQLVTTAMAAMFLRMLEDGESYRATLAQRIAAVPDQSITDLIQPEADELLQIRSDLVRDISRPDTPSHKHEADQ